MSYVRTSCYSPAARFLISGDQHLRNTPFAATGPPRHAGPGQALLKALGPANGEPTDLAGSIEPLVGIAGSQEPGCTP